MVHQRLSTIGLAFAIVTALLLLRPAPAAASFKVCNQTSATINVAIGYSILRQGDSAASSVTVQIVNVSQGWYIIASGECQVTLKADLDKDRGIFVYAEREDKPGTGLLPATTSSFCVNPGRAFQQILPQKADCPDQFVARKFAYRETPLPNYTENIR